ncbi:MAG: PaaI family thioesterase [Bryobacteraceae bacterium]|nr:PaaI family thioesterase [Bryobacteraceae bacterium]MCX7602581.1 PaaI family thioesterase [Bryobacteraceae bacterium]
MDNGISGEPAPAQSYARPNRCFACGKENAIGLKLEFSHRPDGEALAHWTPGEQHEGWPGVVHGGLLSTVLDEAMAHAVLASGLRALTAELRVRFREPAAPGRELTVKGWVVQRSKRLVEAEASIAGQDGSEYAHGWGRFLCVGEPAEPAG